MESDLYERCDPDKIAAGSPNTLALQRAVDMIRVGSTLSSTCNMREVLKIIDDPSLPNEIKALIGEWLFRRIYIVYKIRDPAEKKDMALKFEKPIRNTTNRLIKSKYLHYNDMQATGHLALRFYRDRFQPVDDNFILQLLNDTELVKGYLQDPSITDAELLDHFVEWIATAKTLDQASNILDVALRYYSREPRVIEAYERLRYGEKTTRNLYTDAQNVHDEEIISTTIRAALALVDMTKQHAHVASKSPPDYVRKNLVQHAPARYLDAVDAILERIHMDTTTFRPKDSLRSFNLFDVLLATILYIEHSPIATLLYEVLYEEMDAGKTLCASGFVARFINALQGDPDLPPSIRVTISSHKRIEAIITQRMSKCVVSAKEEVCLGTVDDRYRKEYLLFLRDIANTALPDIIGTEGLTDEIKNGICIALKKIAGARDDESWSIVDGRVQLLFSSA